MKKKFVVSTIFLLFTMFIPLCVCSAQPPLMVLWDLNEWLGGFRFLVSEKLSKGGEIEVDLRDVEEMKLHMVTIVSTAQYLVGATNSCSLLPPVVSKLKKNVGGAIEKFESEFVKFVRKHSLTTKMGRDGVRIANGFEALKESGFPFKDIVEFTGKCYKYQKEAMFPMSWPNIENKEIMDKCKKEAKEVGARNIEMISPLIALDGTLNSLLVTLGPDM